MRVGGRSRHNLEVLHIHRDTEDDSAAELKGGEDEFKRGLQIRRIVDRDEGDTKACGPRSLIHRLKVTIVTARGVAREHEDR